MSWKSYRYCLCYDVVLTASNCWNSNKAQLYLSVALLGKEKHHIDSNAYVNKNTLIVTEQDTLNRIKAVQLEIVVQK